MAMAAAVATTGTLAMVALSDPAPPAGHYAIAESADLLPAANADPLRTELIRCRSLPADSADARCQAAWEVNRRRFMGESRSYVPPIAPQAIEPAPVPAPETATAGAVDTQSQER